MREYIFGYDIRIVILKLEYASESPRRLLKTQTAGLTLTSFSFRKSRMGLITCISYKFPGYTDNDTVSLEITQFENQWGKECKV